MSPGATSAYVGDNTDLVQLREGLDLVGKRLRSVIRALKATGPRIASGAWTPNGTAGSTASRTAS